MSEESTKSTFKAVYCPDVVGNTEEALTEVSALGECTSAKFGEKTFPDGKTHEGSLMADELTSMGELAFAEKNLGT